MALVLSISIVPESASAYPEPRTRGHSLLEDELHSQLDLSREVGAALSDGRLGDGAEIRTVGVVVELRLREIERVEHVERFGAELQRRALCDLRSLIHRHLELRRRMQAQTPIAESGFAGRVARQNQEIIIIQRAARQRRADGLQADGIVGIE